jgi:lipid II:glycine glycyltransferase (peptidoglycan interpeptide bridge formation enzyme)
MKGNTDTDTEVLHVSNGLHTKVRVEKINRDTLKSRAGVFRPDISHGSFLQTDFWAAFKERTGWKAARFSVSFPEEPSFHAELSVLTRHLWAAYTFAYVPHGPNLVPRGADAGEYLEALAEALRPFLGGKCTFIRFDLPWESVSGEAIYLENYIKFGKVKIQSSNEVQVPDTVILDLGQSEESILAGMKPKWRYNIKLASKKGVQVSKCGSEALPQFFDLYKKTAARDKIAIHPESYYESVFTTVEAIKRLDAEYPIEVCLWLATHEGDTLAAIITLYIEGHAIYLYGASSDLKRNLMPAYALQWEAIREGKKLGCIDYDFFGIPPTSDPNHPMYGLYLFKTGFGGRIVHRVGTIDYSYHTMFYAIFTMAEKARRIWYKRILKAQKQR